MGEQYMRFGSIHALRGIAAMGVVLFHLSGNLAPELNELLPNVINVLFSYGYLGVPVFFVISGFVISYSMRSAKITGKYIGNFIVRRSIRLDITYWASILLALVLLIIKNKVTGSEENLPSFVEIILHMFYLQELVQLDPVISVVYWTLCLEVQFYLFFIVLLWSAQKVSASYNVVLTLLISLSLGIYSLFLDLGVAENFLKGLFVSNWHYFLMGVLASHVVQGLRYSSSVLIIWLLIEIMFQLLIGVKAYAVAGVCSSALMYMMWKLGVLDRLFCYKPILYLGTISYTLYLLHPDIGWKVISFGKLLLGGSISPLQAGILLLAGIFVSIVAAHIFHILFERPTQKIAARVKSEPLSKVLREYIMPSERG